MEAGSFAVSDLPAAATGAVPHRSPLRWPGGKSWLTPHVRHWLSARPAATLIEPFAGGASVSLTAVMEGHVRGAVLVDLDGDLAAFWEVVLEHPERLVDRIATFAPTLDAVEGVCRAAPRTRLDRAWRTLVLNRTRHGGIVASGAGTIRNGDGGRGVASRWYPETLIARIRDVARHSGRIVFHHGDALALLPGLAADAASPVAVFCDPPYGPKDGRRRRLYAHCDVAYPDLFGLLDRMGARFLMTLDASVEVERLVESHGFDAVTVAPRDTRNAVRREVLVSPEPLFRAAAA